MIQSAEEVEILEHVTARCTCTFSAVDCQKCKQTKSGFIAARSAALTRMISVGYVSYDKRQGGFILTETGSERWARMRGVMKKLNSSAGTVRPPTTTPEQDALAFDFLV